MAKHVVATVDEIPPGGRKIVEVAGRSIGVFNVERRVLRAAQPLPAPGRAALRRARCSACCCRRQPGEYHYSRPGEILRCPWHGWEFDIRTGQSWFDPRKVRVRAYEVSVASGEALAATAAEPTAGLEKGPYVAETYPVSVERAVRPDRARCVMHLVTVARSP